MKSSASINTAPADIYTVAHAFAGALAGAGGVSPIPALVGAVLFELAEDEIIRRFSPFRHGGVESKDNALLDVLAFSAFYLVGRTMS